ncbi:hypothetical protein PsorP6_016381 [Peronosclerospora sorghi]|uniref:Uncharacterized protein n=1 Tax=Peronosclerospora sorghi TaxID=230839 RepID=A0ACC0VMS2_9STRA|nr:hypothetical protein PsorP6_016381 [Peronosclerospora sorghi]
MSTAFIGCLLKTLVGLFEEEAIYYGRWREFRGETKHEGNELEDVEEEELADELDLFAVSETENVFNEAFLERIRFADERTKRMDWSMYDVFARGRKLNFMNNKAQQFRQWLGLGKISRASLEFLNFVAYHNIGRLVEFAIKKRTGGELRQLETPLLKDEIESGELSSLPPQRFPRIIDAMHSTATKKRRTGDRTVDTKSVDPESMTRVEAMSLPSQPSSSTREAPGTSKPTMELNKTRPMRLKRLR